MNGEMILGTTGWQWEQLDEFTWHGWNCVNGRQVDIQVKTYGRNDYTVWLDGNRNKTLFVGLTQYDARLAWDEFLGIVDAEEE